MKKQLLFPENTEGNPSAFTRHGKPRALKVTLHCLEDTASALDQAAVSLLRELSHLEELDLTDTAPGSASHLTIGEYDAVRELLPVESRGIDHVTRWAIHGVEMWPHWTAAAERTGTRPVSAAVLLPQMPYLEAHLQGHRDLLITTNAALIACADRFPKANVMTPLDGCKVIGLYLRAVRNYVFSRWGGVRESLDRHLFYWVLTRHRTPSMWRYFGACVRAGEHRRDDITYLGNTVLMRLQRALQARDQIGFQFYQPQSNSTRDDMLYHFDYLTLLLVGALDAQARVAHRTYGLTSQERRASFKDEGLIRQLQDTGADGLHSVTSADRFRSFVEVLWSLRGAIHGAANWPIGAVAPGKPERSLCRIGSRAKEIWKAASALRDPGELGFERLVNVEFEPYTCACGLVNEALRSVDAIALNTDVQRLFPPGSHGPQLPDGPPEKDEFRSDVRRRVDLLG